MHPRWQAASKRLDPFVAAPSSMAVVACNRCRQVVQHRSTVHGTPSRAILSCTSHLEPVLLTVRNSTCVAPWPISHLQNGNL